MAGVPITRRGYSSAQLRGLAKRARDAKAARRLLAIALVLDGWSRTAAAQACGMDRQTLRDWVHRYNAEGPEGLSNRPAPGRQRSLSEPQRQQVAAWVRQGPDPQRDGVVRWRCKDLAARIERHFGVRLAERTVSELLRHLRMSHKSGRPYTPQQDAAAVEAHKKTSPSRSGRCCRTMRVAAPSNCGGRMRRGSVSRDR